MLGLDCLSTRLEDHGTDYREFNITLKMRDRNGQFSEQKKYLLCHYDGVMCNASGAVHRWQKLSPPSALAIATPQGQTVYYAPACDELAPGTLRYIDAFFVDDEAGMDNRSVPKGESLKYARPDLTSGDALAAYGIQVVGIRISARYYDYESQAKGKDWAPILSWGTP